MMVGWYEFNILNYTFTWVYVSDGQLDVLFGILGFVVCRYIWSRASLCLGVDSNFFFIYLDTGFDGFSYATSSYWLCNLCRLQASTSPNGDMLRDMH